MAVLGCSARIVDWAALPHGRLGLTIEGSRRFRISSTSASPAHLQMARVQWLPPEEPLALTSANAHLGALLRSLVRHPEMARLGWHIDDADGLRVVNQLAQLLPMPSARRQQLLELPDPVTRLAAIEALIEALS
jgi:Lon protease-like protein